MVQFVWCWATTSSRETYAAAVEAYRTQGSGAKIILKKVPDPQRFGVPRLDGSRVVAYRREARAAAVRLRSDWRLHVRRTVYDIIRSLKPSGRGELEITDVNNAYIERDAMTWEELEGWWTDAGTFESLLHASNLVAETGANKMYFEPEEVAANARQL